VSSLTKPNTRTCNDEIELLPILLSLWASKKTIIATTLAGTAISLGAYATSPEQWVASTYITKPSLYSFYKEVPIKDTETPATPQASEVKLYSSMQNDAFYTAMGIMASRSIALKEAAPKTGKNEPVLYIASANAATQQLAVSQLQSALGAANAEAIALNLPALKPTDSLRAFNALDEVKTANNKSLNKYAFLGVFLGFFLGSLFVVGRFLKRQHQPSI